MSETRPAGGGNGRNRSKSNKKKSRKGNNDRSSGGTKFKGATKDIETAVFYFGSDGQEVNYVKVRDNIFEHIERNFDYPADIVDALRKGTDTPPPESSIGYKTVVVEVRAADGTVTQAGDSPEEIETKREQNRELYKRYLKRQEAYDGNTRKAYSVVWGQCTKGFKRKLKEVTGFKENIELKKDPFKLLDAIQVVVHRGHESVYPYITLLTCLSDVCTMLQKDSEGLGDYQDRQKAAMKLLESVLGKVAPDVLWNEIEAKGENISEAEAKKQCNERFKAVVFLKGLKGAKAEDFRLELANRYLMGEKTAYPENIEEAKDKFARYKSRTPKIKNTKKQNDGGASNRDQSGGTRAAASETGVSFAQTGQQPRGGLGSGGGRGGGGGSGGGGRRCFRCGSESHVLNDCPFTAEQVANRMGVAHVNVDGAAQAPAQQTGSTPSPSSPQDATQSGPTTRSSLRRSTRRAHFGFAQVGAIECIDCVDHEDPETAVDDAGVTLETHSVTHLSKAQLASMDAAAKWHVLLDSQSTADIFNNIELLINVRYEPKYRLVLRTNGGGLTTQWRGELPGYGLVWYHPDALTNILSLSRVIKAGHHVEFVTTFIKLHV